MWVHCARLQVAQLVERGLAGCDAQLQADKGARLLWDQAVVALLTAKVLHGSIHCWLFTVGCWPNTCC